MKRVAFRMKLHPGNVVEYKRRHDTIWPELVTLLHESGISEYSIFLDEETHHLFGVLKIEDALALDKLPEFEIMKRWWAYMKDLMETNPDHSPVSVPLREVFYMP
jgi:L-rhamnose mutarotase